MKFFGSLPVEKHLENKRGKKPLIPSGIFTRQPTAEIPIEVSLSE